MGKVCVTYLFRRTTKSDDVKGINNCLQHFSKTSLEDSIEPKNYTLFAL